MYRIVRRFRDKPGSELTPRHTEVMETGLTRAEAQEHCDDPETSSRTCEEDLYDGEYLSWFDSFEEE